MARRATIIDAAVDLWGDAWEVRERRATAHGFAVLLGWPAAAVRGKGGAGGPRVIVTPSLSEHFERHRRAGAGLALPIGATAIKRIRRLLGHHRQIDAAAWWQDRLTDLADLTIELFAARHGVSVGAVANARIALLGPTLRPAGWWRAADIVDVVLADRPVAEIADALDMPAGSIRRLRAAMREAELHPRRLRYPPRRQAAARKVVMEQMLAAGATYAEVAAAAGVTRAAVAKRVLEGSVPVSHTRDLRQDRRTARDHQPRRREASCLAPPARPGRRRYRQPSRPPGARLDQIAVAAESHRKEIQDMPTIEHSRWIDIGNGERSAVVVASDQPTNYKALHVRPWPNGEFFSYVNGELRGRASTMTAAKRIASDYARAQLTD